MERGRAYTERMIRRTAALLAALVTVPLWVAAVTGAVEIRACVPAGSPLLRAELLLLRPAPACPTGQSLGDGALVVVGTICLVTVLAGLGSAAALAGLGSVLGRLARLAGRLVDVVTPWRRAPSGPLIPSREPAAGVSPVRTAWMLDRLVDGAVARRGPPALA